MLFHSCTVENGASLDTISIHYTISIAWNHFHCKTNPSGGHKGNLIIPTSTKIVWTALVLLVPNGLILLRIAKVNGNSCYRENADTIIVEIKIAILLVPWNTNPIVVICIYHKSVSNPWVIIARACRNGDRLVNQLAYTYILTLHFGKIEFRHRKNKTDSTTYTYTPTEMPQCTNTTCVRTAIMKYM